MRRVRGALCLGVLFAVLATAFSLLGQNHTGSAQPTYVGADTCATCHPDEWNLWKVSGHPYMLMDAVEAQSRGLPLPAGYDLADISYVVGGYKWKSRYLDQNGYFITEAPPGTPGNNQYNLMTGRWVDYHAGDVNKPYTCGACHTTGFSDTGNQGGKPGIEGTWVYEGVECERCHGPGSDHAGNPTGVDMTIDTTAAACGECHIRGDAATIPAKGGFIRHHEQYNEFLASPHSSLGCVSCHDPHTKAEFSITTTCADCHQDEAQSYAGTPMDTFNVTCEDCHMPMATKSAEMLGPNQGDVKTHLFTINTDPNASMFTEDGSFVALDGAGKGSVTLDFACLQCHQSEMVEWAAAAAAGFHAPAPTPTPTPTPSPTPTLTPTPTPEATPTPTPAGPTQFPETGTGSGTSAGVLSTGGLVLLSVLGMSLAVLASAAWVRGRRNRA